MIYNFHIMHFRHLHNLYKCVWNLKKQEKNPFIHKRNIELISVVKKATEKVAI